MIKFYPHQEAALEKSKDMTHVAYYHDMGLGKTFTGAEKMFRLGAKVNLIICQKSKVNDWVEHFASHYNSIHDVFDLTKKLDYEGFIKTATTNDVDDNYKIVGVINYELSFRRPELLKLRDFTLMLDESSMIQNDTAKRTKFILKMKPANVILLSGTPTGGKYEKLYSQMKLLGWNITKRLYWSQYVEVKHLDMLGRSIPVVVGYKNVDRLKAKMREYGCQFLKTEDVFDLPERQFIKTFVPVTTSYKKFRKNRILIDDVLRIELVGDTTLKRMLYERQLCSMYNKNKLEAFADLVESTEDRLIVFYNFTEELNQMLRVINDRPISVVNGSGKDLKAYNEKSNSITFIQYQAGAMGLNLQKSNKIVYYSPTLSSELYEQSKKRIHRIGQERPCFYYKLVVKNSIEERIYETLAMRKDFTEKLYEETCIK